MNTQPLTLMEPTSPEFQAENDKQNLISEREDFPEERKPFSQRFKEFFPKYRNVIGFFICGLINNFVYVVFLSAAEDIIPGSSGAILIASILPGLITKMILPWFMSNLPFWIRILVVCLAALGAFQLAIWPDVIAIKLIGVCLGSFSSGFGEITYLALASYYNKNVISGWSSGTGGAGIAGSLSYLALTEWIGLDKKLTLIIISPLPVLTFVSYWFILTHEELKTGSNGDYVQHHNPESAELDHNEVKPDPPALTFMEKLKFIRPLLPYAIPLLVVYYFEYVINQGVSPAIAFPDDGWDDKKAYKYYQALYQVGVFLSRSSVQIFPIRMIWILAVLQILNFVIFLSEAWKRWLPYIYFVFVLVVWEGLLGGATYVNAMFMIAGEVEERYKEFSLGFISVANDIGISLSAVTSLFLEKYLKDKNNIHD